MIDLLHHRDNMESLQMELQNESPFTDIKIDMFPVDSLSAIHGAISRIKLKFNTQCIQFLFNNVPYSLHHNPSNESHQDPLQTFRSLMDCNVWNLIHWTRSFLPLLLHQSNIEGNRKCFMINTSTMRAACCTADSMNDVMEHTVYSLTEVLRSEIEGIVSNLHLNGNSAFDLRVKMLCTGFAGGNDFKMNSDHKIFKKDMVTAAEKDMLSKHLEVSQEKLGRIVFEGIRDLKIFEIQTDPKLFRILATDKMIPFVDPEREKKPDWYTKKFFKSLLSKL